MANEIINAQPTIEETLGIEQEQPIMSEIPQQPIQTEPVVEPVIEPSKKDKPGDKFKKAFKKREEERLGKAEVERREVGQVREEEIAKEQEDIKIQAQNDQKIVEIDEQINNLKTDIEYANARGLSSEAMQSKIKELEVEKNKLSGTPMAGEDLKPFPVDQIDPEQLTGEVEGSKEPATVGDVKDAMNPDNFEVDKNEVIDQAKEINKQRTNIQAQQLALQNEIDEQRSMVDKAMQNMREEDTKLMAIDTNRFWKNKNTFEKIMLGAALIFGGAGGVNRAAQIVNNQIQQDIDAQKTDNKTKLAKREEAFRRVNAELTRMEKLTSSQAKIENIKLLKAKLAAEQVKANEERKQLQHAAQLKDLILKKGIKVEDLSPSQINAIFSKEDFARAKDLRNEYNKQTTKLGTREVVNAFRDIKALANKEDVSGPTDIFLLTKAMKFIDPNSVVREGEFHIAETASPPIKAVVRIAQKMAKGTRLTEGDRKNFEDNARMLLKTKLKTQQSINNRYKSLSRQNGLPSSMIVEDFSISQVSPREALYEKQKVKNPKLKRSTFDNSLDRLIDAGKLSSKFKD